MADDNVDLKAIHEAVRDLPDAVKGMRGEIDGLKKELAEAKSIYRPGLSALDDRSQRERDRDGVFSLGAMIRGIVAEKLLRKQYAEGCLEGVRKDSRDWRDGGFTAEIVLQTKAMSTTAGSGGYFAPELWMTEWINLLAAKSVAVPLCERWPNLVNADVRMGRLATGSTGYWIGEGSSITISSGTDEQISVAPHEACARVQVSNQLLKMSNPAIEGILRTNMLDVVIRLVDLGIFTGTGSSNQPSGMTSAVGASNTVTAGSAAITWAKLEEFVYDLALANAPFGKVVWFLHPRTLSAIRQLTTTYYPQFVGTPVGMALGRELAGNGLLGFPVHTTTQLPITGGAGVNEATMLFADMSECILADWGAPEFAASSEIAFDANSTQLRMIWLVDVCFKHRASFVKCTDTTS